MGWSGMNSCSTGPAVHKECQCPPPLPGDPLDNRSHTTRSWSPGTTAAPAPQPHWPDARAETAADAYRSPGEHDLVRPHRWLPPPTGRGPRRRRTPSGLHRVTL
ncbi:hypothetical protein GCM10023084_82070 [Streptomyces lacrimifluminis]|uniref:Uncharacterized protein n=1 Tax=Streptomyces lacrimifluminis TaxID=1500077 RepID=A0A917PDM6_9ACTN|nr:hypothetical protein GCM10012282_80850 [Streptomyces lacrimifluminis]